MFFLLTPIGKIQLEFRFLKNVSFFFSLYMSALNNFPCILLQFTGSYGLLSKKGQGNC